MIPSSRGRIVAALHYEFFVKGQAERVADLENFFNEATSDTRPGNIRTYQVCWIVLNSAVLPPRLVELLMVPAAVVEGRLLDASRRRGLDTARPIARPATRQPLTRRG